jgi:FSR family fosmidomycin resistance protein-like MFS transporter
MQIAETVNDANRADAAPIKRRSLVAASLAHALHDGYTDGLYASCRFGRRSSGLSYAGLAILRALYCGTMGGLQIPGDRLVRTLSSRAALVLLEESLSPPPAYQPRPDTDRCMRRARLRRCPWPR